MCACEGLLLIGAWGINRVVANGSTNPKRERTQEEVIACLRSDLHDMDEYAGGPLRASRIAHMLTRAYAGQAQGGGMQKNGLMICEAFEFGAEQERLVFDTNRVL